MNYTKEELDIGGLYAQKLTPEKESGKLVILSHGYNSSHESLLDMAKALAKNGHTALCYDFAGGSTRSKSTGSSLDLSIDSEIGDLEAIVGEMEKAGYDRIALYGESQGGFVSALVAAAHPERFIGAALLYPAFCIQDDWKDREAPEKFGFMGMELSRKFVDGMPTYDVFERISRFEKPVLIMHGNRDPLVRLSYAEKAAESFKNARLEVFEGESHGFRSGARLRAIAMTVEFIEGL